VKLFLRFVTGMVAILVELSVCGCSSAWRGMAVPPLHLKFGSELKGAPLPARKEPSAPLPQIELAWLETGEFYPPGCRRITPELDVPVSLVDTPRAHFPSADTCPSPDGSWTLYCEAYGRQRLIHSLISQRAGAAHVRTFYTTPKATSVLWSPNNDRVAVTVITGGNRSMVLWLDVRDFTLGDPIYPVHALSGYFTAVQLDSPQFMAAYHWTREGCLVVRGAGVESIPPYTTFGYEVLVDPRTPGGPTLRFLRGFTKPAAATHAGTR
jgi:hypothetical protein